GGLRLHPGQPEIRCIRAPPVENAPRPILRYSTRAPVAGARPAGTIDDAQQSGTARTVAARGTRGGTVSCGYYQRLPSKLARCSPRQRLADTLWAAIARLRSANSLQGMRQMPSSAASWFSASPGSPNVR